MTSRNSSSGNLTVFTGREKVLLDSRFVAGFIARPVKAIVMVPLSCRCSYIPAQGSAPMRLKGGGFLIYGRVHPVPTLVVNYMVFEYMVVGCPGYASPLSLV